MQTTLTRIFIVLESESHDLSANCDKIFRKPRKFKNRWFPKKKVFIEIESDFSAKIGNSDVFSAQNKVVSTKKRSSSKLSLIFWPKSVIQTFFQAASRHILYNFSTQFSLGGGGCFQFLTKNRPQKHQKREILHTSQANGGAVAPPPPPPSGYATGCNSGFNKV